MSEFQIFCDGSCDMPRDIAKQNNIKIIPFYVSLDGSNYEKEIEELSLDRFYNFVVVEKGFPKTSLPSASDYIDAFLPAIEKGLDVICFTITDTLSSSYLSACTAQNMLEESHPNAKIYIVNSWAATGSLSLMVQESAKMQRQGYSILEVYNYAQAVKEDTRIIFMVGALTHLEKGGRVGKLAALSGSILQIKPLIILKGGEISTAGTSRSRKKGMEKLALITKEHFKSTGENPSDYLFCIGTTNTSKEAQPFAELVLKEIPNAGFLPPFQIGATIATHTGPGTIGLCFCKKFECYQ